MIMEAPIPATIDWDAMWGGWFEDTYDPDIPPVTLPDRLEDLEF